MARGRKPGSTTATRTGAKPALAFEATLWAAADKLRGDMDAAEYKHVALGLIFLKYISDRFEERRRQAPADPEEKDLVDERDLYLGDNVFWVPERARWDYLKSRATSVEPTIGALIDQAMLDLEKENPSLLGVLTKNYARPELDQTKLGEVIKLFSDLAFRDEHRGEDVLGRVYEYFLGQFAIAEGKRGEQFYTAGCVVKLLVEMIQPFKGRVFDPCCGSGGMFVQSERFIAAHNGKRYDASIFGQESNPTTWCLAKMNLAIRGIEANLGSKWADSFHEDLHAGLKADFVLANPPFNDSDWSGERLRSGERWRYGVPPVCNANFAWVQHFIHHLAPPMASPASCSPTGRCPANSRARARSGRASSRPTSSTASSACRGNYSSRRRFRSRCGSSPATSRTGSCATNACATGGARRCSSTPARSARWKPAR